MSKMYPSIQALLADGAAMRGFRSGSGLRVLRVDRRGEMLAYAEHPYAEEGLRILEDDARAGGRPYAEVYGPVEIHYVSGCDCACSVFDGVILSGDAVEAFVDGDEVVLRRGREDCKEIARAETLEAALASLEAEAPTTTSADARLADDILECRSGAAR